VRVKPGGGGALKPGGGGTLKPGGGCTFVLLSAFDSESIESSAS